MSKSLKKMTKAITAAFLSLAQVQLLISPSVSADDSSSNNAVTLYGGWLEEAYAEWNSSVIGNNVNVSYAEKGSNEYISVDKELIREDRVDIPGLKGNTEYTLKIEGDKSTQQCSVKTLSFDRSGYAHYNFQDIGAYKDDGTLKEDITVIYVTNENKDTVTYNGKTGIYNIFFSAKPKNVLFRFIGSIDVPSGTVPNDGSHNDGSNMLYLQNSSNVTIEGIGDDTNLIEWGIEMKRCTSCEVRNLWLGKYPDDGISMTGNTEIRSAHIWVHNNTIEKGFNAYAGGEHVDEDKADGDGSVDMKWSEYVTVSYNEFKDCHKTSLVGGKADQEQDYITYHHNWFNNTSSRNPRARNAHIHSFNNYFTTNSEYGICASYNSKIFSESNYFEKTNSPLYAINMGKDQFSGTIKSYNDKFVDCVPDEGLAYKIVDNRNDSPNIPNLIDGGEAYDNFDLNIYSYTVQTPDEARISIKQYAGRMKCDNSTITESETEPVTEPVTEEPVTEPATESTTEANSVVCDVNGDDVFNIADIVLFQKWLLAVPDTSIVNWESADLCKDEKLDLFDLCEMRKLLISSVK